MKRFKYLLIIMLCTAFGLPVFAQQPKLSMEINYGINTPVGSFKSDIVNKTSFRGWNANILYGITDKLSLGLQAGFNDYYQKFPRKEYNIKNGAISAVRSNSIQTIPLLVKGRFNLAPTAMIQPYIGAGIGGNLVSFNQYSGEFVSSKSGVYFAASPEAGITIPFNKRGTSGLSIGANYNYMPFTYGSTKNLNNWGVYAGIKLPLK